MLNNKSTVLLNDLGVPFFPQQSNLNEVTCRNRICIYVWMKDLVVERRFWVLQLSTNKLYPNIARVFTTFLYTFRESVSPFLAVLHLEFILPQLWHYNAKFHSAIRFLFHFGYRGSVRVPRFACIKRLGEKHLMRFEELNLLISFFVSLKDDLILMFIKYPRVRKLLMLRVHV